MSRILNILSAAAIPLMAVWKNEPRARMGKKNFGRQEDDGKDRSERGVALRELHEGHDDSRGRAPQKAKRSITVMELSCMTSRRMVACLKLSASRFMAS